MHNVIAGLLIVAGAIHLVPIVGVLGADRLAALYGLSFDEPNIAILMRHRAILFGLLGAFLVYAAFRPVLLPLAFVAGFVSVLSCIAIAWSTGGYNEAVRSIVIGDIVALVCLIMALALLMNSRHRS